MDTLLDFDKLHKPGVHQRVLVIAIAGLAPGTLAP
jgi:hypothetical protein